MIDSKLQNTWQEMSALLKNKVSSTVFTNWLHKLVPVSMDNECITLKAPSKKAQETFQQKYLQYLVIACYEVTNQMLQVVIICDEKKPRKPRATAAVSTKKTKEKENEQILVELQKQTRGRAKKIKESASNLFQPTLGEALDIPPQEAEKEKHEEQIYIPPETTLNNQYTFSSFVIGSANEFAHAAAFAVANSPSQAFNPFFMYGGVGVGKTHLMHAIAHHVLEKFPEKKVLYISCEKFTNDLVNSIKFGKTNSFREKYRNIDVLLVDDIQFLTNKERIQEEFFHTFNELKDANKQIILSSDRHPSEIETLSDRLRSRFEGGLITDIKVPDLETRIAILERKCAMENVHVPADVLNFIATNIKDNIRTLEGALTRVIAYASVTHYPITYKFATDTLKDIMKVPKAVVQNTAAMSIPHIQEVIAGYFKITVADINSKKRARVIVYPRQIAMFLARELTSFSLPKIAQGFGKKDHTTVMHACKKIKKMIETEADTANLINELRQKILE